MLRTDDKQTVPDQDNQDSDGSTLSAAANRAIARPVEKTISAAVIVGVVQLIEAAILAIIGVAIYASYVIDGVDGFYAIMILSVIALSNILMNVVNAHRIAAYRGFGRQIGKVLGVWAIVFVIILIGVFLFKASELTSRVWIVSWFLSGAIFILAFRLGLRSLIRRWTSEGKLKRRTVIVGGGQDAEILINAIENSAANDIEIFGLFDDRVDERSPDEVAGCPKLGTVDQLVEFARRTPVDLIVVSLPLSAESRVLHMLKKLWVLPVDIRLSAHLSKLKFKAKTYSYLGDVAVFDMADRPISDWNLVFKWLFDKTVAATALVFLSPLMIGTAIAIKLGSKGPVLFKQKRHGFNNELIEIYKFRSMYTDMSDAQAATLVTKDDPRVTKVGRFIRKTSIDELPQLFNVLKNEISIIGPRPHALQAKAANKLYNEAVDGYFARHKVKPGITGWAQINGWRGETDTIDKIMQRVNHDLYYIENWSLVFDAYILIMTPVALFAQRENAY